MGRFTLPLGNETLTTLEKTPFVLLFVDALNETPEDNFRGAAQGVVTGADGIDCLVDISSPWLRKQIQGYGFRVEIFTPIGDNGKR